MYSTTSRRRRYDFIVTDGASLCCTMDDYYQLTCFNSCFSLLQAQELMFLASRGSLPSAPTTVARMPEAHVFPPAKVTVPEVSPTKPMMLQKPQLVSSPVPAISKPISVVSQATSLPRSASSSNVDSNVTKSSGPLVVPPTSLPPPAQPETLATTTAAAIMPRGMPINCLHELYCDVMIVVRTSDELLQCMIYFSFFHCSCPSSAEGIPCPILGEAKGKVEIIYLRDNCSFDPVSKPNYQSDPTFFSLLI
ncbi:hypothetical protein EE612_047653 [Oryza sativa]|nr:hypothetical protein EE612_047653 [Oryza sativa]